MRSLFFTMACLASTATLYAGVTPLASGLYDVDYEFNLQRGTLHGSDITDIIIFETDGDKVHVDSSFSASAKGPSRISHAVPFAPTRALVLGLDRAPASSGLKDHLVVFMDPDFAAGALTKSKFSEVFMAVEGRDRLRHSALVQGLIDVSLGDSAALGPLLDFFTLDAGTLAAFDPRGSFRVVEFSAPTPIDVVPVPASMLLLGSGLVSLAGFRRRLVQG